MPLTVDNGERICFKISIPNQVEYRAALMGQLNDLGYWFTWDHERADYHNIPQKNLDVASLWGDIVSRGEWVLCPDNEDGCTSYPAVSPLISYAPQSLVTQPDYTSLG